MKVIVNTDEEQVKTIRELLKKDPHCPCSIIKDDTTICPCKDFREQQEEGLCHCGLYKKIKE